jgi:predicted nucleic acid-binding protein
MKVCLKCGFEKDESEFRKYRNKKVKMKKPFYLTKTCKKCLYKKEKLIRIKKNNSELSKKTFRQSENNRMSVWLKQQSINLTDYYVKRIITKFGKRKVDVSKEMIEAKRAQLLMERIKYKIEKSGVSICGDCKKRVDTSEFIFEVNKKTGKKYFQRRCKDCRNRKSKEYRQKRKHDTKRST